MNIFITGAAGFIGSNLIKFHLDQGNDVWAIDNFLTGKKENIAPFLSHPKFHFEEVDLCKFSGLEKVISWSDRIYHMAAIVGQKLVITHPVEVLSVNIRTTELILEAMARVKKDVRLLIASSSCVYDRIPLNQPKEESANFVMTPGKFTQETYPLSKIVNEVMGLSYAASKQVHAVIARFFNVIGPNQTGAYGMVVPTFIQQALSNKPITVYGDGNQTRSFCYIEDVVRILHLLMETAEAKGHIVNIGNKEEISIIALARLIKEKTDSCSQIVYIPYKEAYGMDFEDVKRRSCPSLDQLQRLIGTFFLSPLDMVLDKIIKFNNNKLI